MKHERYNRAFYQKKMHLENVTKSSVQNPFFIISWFYFLRETTKQNEKKNKAFKQSWLFNRVVGTLRKCHAFASYSEKPQRDLCYTGTAS